MFDSALIYRSGIYKTNLLSFSKRREKKRGGGAIKDLNLIRWLL
jgi:hypothetical protein